MYYETIQGNPFAYRTSYSLIHYQYNRKPTLRNISDRLVSGVPSEFFARCCVLCQFIFVSRRQSWLFSFSTVRLLNRTSVPSSLLILLLASRYKSYRITQILLFAVSIASGSRLIYQINHSNWLTNMKQVRC